MTQVLVFWTIAGATCAWAIGDALRLLGRALPLARLVWTTGAVLFVIHSVSAFVLIYGGSHTRAIAETARQTAAMTGVASGAGLFVNYLFLAIWIVDGVWWWLAGVESGGRFGRLGWTRVGFFLFMFLNGAVVFADGWMRLIGLVAVSVVIGALFARHARTTSSARRS
jgi:hypothetical protein